LTGPGGNVRLPIFLHYDFLREIADLWFFLVRFLVDVLVP